MNHQPAALTEPDGLNAARRTWALTAIWLTVTLAVMDGAIVNIALPTIAAQVGVEASASVWVVNAYQLAVVMLLLPLASLGEILGHKRVYQAGLVVFVLASLATAFGHSLTALAIARFFQGIGAAAIMAINGALVRFTFPRAMLGRGLGYNALVAAVANAAAPSVAAVILAIADWRWLFLINLPLGLLAFAVGWRALPAPARIDRPFDWSSALLTGAMFAAFFFALSDLTHGSLSAMTIGLMIAGVLTAVLLFRIAGRQNSPLIPLDLLRIPVLRLSYAASICSFGAQMIGLVALPFYLQGTFGFDHARIGIVITAIPVGVAIAAPVAGRLSERFPAGLLGCIGLAILSTSYLMLALLGGLAPLPGLVLLMAGCGIGFGLFQAPNNRTMLTMSPAHRSGAAAGMLATARLVGQMLGALAVASLFRLTATTSVAPFVAASGLGALAAVFSIGRTKAKLG